MVPSTGDAPVPANPSPTQLGTGQTWLRNTQVTSLQMVNSADAGSAAKSKSSSSTSNTSTTTPLNNPVTTAAAPALSSLAKSAGLGTTTTASAPPLQSFTSLLSAAIAPLFPAMTWINTACPQSPAYLHIPGLQSFLGPNGTSATSSTGDPYVDWVDSIVNNNGQPLQVGSAPFYGLNGTSTAFSALDQGIGIATTLMSLVPGVGAGMQFASGLNQFMETGDPTGLILSAAGFVAMVNPCGMVAKGLSAYYAVSSALEFAANPTDPMAGLHILGVIGGVAGMFSACFAAGTPILTPDGAITVEQIKCGDLVHSRDESDPSGAIEAKVVEELFVTVAPVLDLRIKGRTISTTGGHPFYAQDRGWVPASELEPGEHVLALSGEWLQVEGVDDVGHVTTVYNFRVADHHTYFVGCEEWGWSLWAHNAYQKPNRTTEWSVERAVARASHNTFGTFHKSGVDGTWWSKDMTGHGGSAWKVFKETRKGLEWVADADRFGNYIVGKHKSSTGEFIPWGHLKKQ